MVGQRTLTPYIQVRILVSQPNDFNTQLPHPVGDIRNVFNYTGFSFELLEGLPSLQHNYQATVTDDFVSLIKYPVFYSMICMDMPCSLGHYISEL
jgi:hypothetical protein